MKQVAEAQLLGPKTPGTTMSRCTMPTVAETTTIKDREVEVTTDLVIIGASGVKSPVTSQRTALTQTQDLEELEVRNLEAASTAKKRVTLRVTVPRSVVTTDVAARAAVWTAVATSARERQKALR